MRHQRTAFFLALLLGAVWIFSAYGKVLNTADFIRLVYRFELPNWITIWAYAIPTLELVIGSALVLQMHRKRLALTSLITLGVFTAVYLYGYMAKEIEDCGCFGNSSFFDSSPLIVIGRNMILMAISGVLWSSQARQRPPHRVSKILLVVIAIAAAFLSGRSSTMAEAKVKAVSDLSDPFNVTGMSVNDTALSGFIPADTTKSVLIFAFSLNCPHCWDAVETVKAYKRSGTVDSIVGVTFGTPAEADMFSKEFDVNFPIRLVPLREMTAITSTVPRVFVVKRGRVVATFTSPVMSFRTFNDHYSTGP